MVHQHQYFNQNKQWINNEEGGMIWYEIPINCPIRKI